MIAWFVLWCLIWDGKSGVWAKYLSVEESPTWNRLTTSPTTDGPSLGHIAQQVVGPTWGRSPLSGDLITIVVPGMVLSHGKVADLGLLTLTSANHRKVDGTYQTNLTVVHSDLITTYKYDLNGPSGRLTVDAPSRLYSIHLSSAATDADCATELKELRLHKEQEVLISGKGESLQQLESALQIVRHQLTLQSRATAYHNIWANVAANIRSSELPLCQEIA